jgi:DNA-binding response OmpR family regulator
MAHIPVIALSANAMPRDIEKGQQAGFFRYLTKPIKIGEFMHTLDLALQGAFQSDVAAWEFRRIKEAPSPSGGRACAASERARGWGWVRRMKPTPILTFPLKGKGLSVGR